jgi:hypothetical protein
VECHTCLLGSTTNRHCTPPRQPDSLLGRLRVPQATVDHPADRRCLSPAACQVCLRLEVRLGWECRRLDSRRLWPTHLPTSKGEGREFWDCMNWARGNLHVHMNEFVRGFVFFWAVCIARRFCYISQKRNRLRNGRQRQIVRSEKVAIVRIAFVMLFGRYCSDSL